MIRYMGEYFVIAIRIAVPIFIVIMLLNVVLGVLAKTAPQMNMFVIGIQLKIFLGFAVLLIMMSFLPKITDFVYHQMQDMVIDVLEAF